MSKPISPTRAAANAARARQACIDMANARMAARAAKLAAKQAARKAG